MSGQAKPVVYGSIKNKVVATDLLEERAKKDFDEKVGGGLVSLIDKECHDRYKEAVEFTSSDPIMRNSHKFYEMTREELWVSGM
mmetsp:Transcript_18121/g.30956  ORF Transcript_18121/g.30956 Transcript_18121/m.30956 type:complete len:84 (+) Transcript_18121:40-291(+)